VAAIATKKRSSRKPPERLLQKEPMGRYLQDKLRISRFIEATGYVNMREFRRHLATCLDVARESKHPVTIIYRGKPFASIGPPPKDIQPPTKR